jgi:Obg family GTPase CgtA-like protein
MTIWNLDEAVRRFQRKLREMGITEALQEAGAQPGDTIYIGEVELVWEE